MLTPVRHVSHSNAVRLFALTTGLMFRGFLRNAQPMAVCRPALFGLP